MFFVALDVQMAKECGFPQISHWSTLHVLYENRKIGRKLKSSINIKKRRQTKTFFRFFLNFFKDRNRERTKFHLFWWQYEWRQKTIDRRWVYAKLSYLRDNLFWFCYCCGRVQVDNTYFCFFFPLPS